MKLTSGNKMDLMFAVMLCGLVAIAIYGAAKMPVRAGGFRKMIIEAGKEIKAIKKEIDEEDDTLQP